MSYLGKIVRFLAHSSTFLLKEHVKHAYDLIHIHSIPDFEIFAAILPKLSGAKLILDIHDIVPELYVRSGSVERVVGFAVTRSLTKNSTDAYDGIVYLSSSFPIIIASSTS
jgi:hypothetical protein